MVVVVVGVGTFLKVDINEGDGNIGGTGCGSGGGDGYCRGVSRNFCRSVLLTNASVWLVYLYILVGCDGG